MTARPPLLSIIAYARAGALEHAWRMFQAAGLEGVEDDAEVLSVRGRLLKDRALAASGAERAVLFKRAAEAYAAAGAISGASYPLINAATLSLLGGETAQAHRFAGRVLDLARRGEAQPDTPYYQAATPAEALLVLGEVEAGRQALAQAISLAPEAWEDHASTLRQCALVLRAQGLDVDWLDAFRPPRCLHYAGRMGGMETEDHGAASTVARFIADQRIGFGFGALAAGADIVIAEALLAAGAELHLVLPAPLPLFRAISVEPFGSGWCARFDAALAQVATLEIVDHAAAHIGPQQIELAAEVAMGQAVAHARTLQSQAVQLILTNGDDDNPGASTSRSRDIWAASRRAQHLLPFAGSGGESSTPASPTLDRAGDQLVALLVLDLGKDPLGSGAAQRLAAALRIDEPPTFHRWTDGGVCLAYARCETAAAAALKAMDLFASAEDTRAGLHYAVVDRLADPFGGPEQPSGPGPGVAARVATVAPLGAVYASGAFAAAWEAQAALDRPPQYVGDLESVSPEAPFRLFVLPRQSVTA